jgi:hypothetical protein
MAGQINVVVHTLGILASLPHILRPGEVIESLSLGAGNTGRRHDLETDLRVAEFKFISWRGGAEAIRQNTLFVDLFNLANSPTSKPREMYVVGKEQPLKFLNNNRSIRSVLSKHSSTQVRFDQQHASDQFTTVPDRADDRSTASRGRSPAACSGVRTPAGAARRGPSARWRSSARATHTRGPRGSRMGIGIQTADGPSSRRWGAD